MQKKKGTSGMLFFLYLSKYILLPQFIYTPQPFFPSILSIILDSIFDSML